MSDRPKFVLERQTRLNTTPRTDAIPPGAGVYADWLNMREHARTLELELARANELLSELHGKLLHSNSDKSDAAK